MNYENQLKKIELSKVNRRGKFEKQKLMGKVKEIKIKILLRGLNEINY